ncbi:MAG: hypothetical protein ACPGVN_02395 [Alphaproteobacteria bacterium]
MTMKANQKNSVKTYVIGHFLPTIALILGMTLGQAQALAETPIEVSDEIRATVPSPLQPWIDWSLRGDNLEQCPQVAGSTRCSWVSDLVFMSAGGGDKADGLDFSFNAEQLKAGWLALPGGATWPASVTVGGETVAVIKSDINEPLIYLEAGEHEVKGSFDWKDRPAFVAVPLNFGFGLFDGTAVDVASGRLALESKISDKPQVETRNAAELEVFRHLLDGHPFKVTTRLKLSVSGAPRQLKIKNVTLPDFSVVQMNSPLDIRLETDGTLLVKVRAGSWNVDLLSTQQQPVMAVKLNPTDVSAIGEDLVDEAEQEVLVAEHELWSLQSAAWLRQLQTSGGKSLDPSRTNTPREWHSFPTYLMSEDAKALNFTVLSRGDKNPEPDSLRLSRQFWYDFQGGGWTVADTISGQINRSSRLNAQQEMALGAASISGRPQLVSKLADSEALGVGVQRGHLQLAAQSRLNKGLKAVPAVGWDTKVTNLDATLHLPPGWKSVYISGVDSASETWFFQWTLLDIFLVLLVFGALLRWVGVVPGVVGLLALVLVQFDLPGFGLTLLVMVAIDAIVVLFLKQQSWFRWVFRLTQSALLFGLVIGFLMFAVSDLQKAIFPQMERFYTERAPTDGFNNASPVRLQAPAPQSNLAEMAFEDQSQIFLGADRDANEQIQQMPRNQPIITKQAKRKERLSSSSTLSFNKASYYEQKLGQANQTGEGLSNWSKSTGVRLSWRGPVTPAQSFSVYALSPAMNLVVTSLKVLGLFLLLLLVTLKFTRFGGSLMGPTNHTDDENVEVPSSRNAKPFGGLLRKLTKTNLAVVGLAFVLLAGQNMGSTAHAQNVTGDAGQATYVPDARTLSDLRTYLLKKLRVNSLCGQNCLMMNKISVTQTGNRLKVDLSYNATEDTAFLLPRIDGWVPSSIAVSGLSGEKVRTLNISGAGRFVRVPAGNGTVSLAGVFSARQPVSIATSTAVPKWVVLVDDMEVSGGEDDKSRRLLTLTPKQKAVRAASAQELTQGEEAQLATPTLVHRSLSAGLKWQLYTTVTRVAGTNRAAAINVPLIKGERVISDGVEIKNQIVKLNFPAGVNQLGWSSQLDPREMLELKAIDAGLGLDQSGASVGLAISENIAEIWSVSNTSLWHLKSKGLPNTNSNLSASLSGSLSGRQNNSIGQFNSLRLESDASTQHFYPWPGETLALEFEQPVAAEGPLQNIDNHSVVYKIGHNLNKVTTNIQLTSSLGGRKLFSLPYGATDPTVIIDGRQQPLVLEDQSSGKKKPIGKVAVLSFGPGTHQISVSWDIDGGLKNTFYGLVGRTSAYDLGTLSVNNKISVEVPRDRWLLWASLKSDQSIASVGPAILIWAYLPIALILSILLANFAPVPLRSVGWFLLLAGLSQAAFPASIAVVVFLVAIAFLPNLNGRIKNAYLFNARQLFIGFWALVTVITFVYAIVQGLLSSPDMKVAGYGSWSYGLSWFIDRWQGETPVVQLITAPLWVFRLCMLLWALWLAFTVLNLAQWFMGQVSTEGFLKKMSLPSFSSSTDVEKTSASKKIEIKTGDASHD